MRRLLERFVDSQRGLCQRIARFLPADYRIDGFSDFAKLLTPYLTWGARVYDVGGGKRPFIDPSTKATLGLNVVGLDIDENELVSAPGGAYDEIICVDITRYPGRADADVVICKTLLEHVSSTEAALAAIVSILRPEGRAVLFVPSRNAIHARLNLILPEPVRKAILQILYPQSHTYVGFPAYYDRCTPTDFRRLAAMHGLIVEEQKVYFSGAYCACFVPLYLVWCLWIVAYRWLAKDQAAELFAMVLRKPGYVITGEHGYAVELQ